MAFLRRQIISTSKLHGLSVEAPPPKFPRWGPGGDLPADFCGIQALGLSLLRLRFNTCVLMSVVAMVLQRHTC